jgi:aldehyde dehydrogenase (NAD+)
VFADADLEKALPIVTNAIIVNSGQTCVAGSRLLVHESIVDAVRDLFATKFRTLVAGSHEGQHDLGPLINAKQQRRVMGMIAAARASDVPVIAEGGSRKARRPAASTSPPHCSAPSHPTIRWPGRRCSDRCWP